MSDDSLPKHLLVAETERLLIRQYRAEDLDELYALLSDPVVMAAWPAPFDRAQTEVWLQRALLNYRVFGLGRWAVVRKDTGRLIGDCGLLPLKIDGLATHDLGWIFHHAQWNKGYATEAAAACVRHAFTTLGLERLYARMPADHAASIRVAEKIGMSRVRLFPNPRNRDLPTCLYTIACVDSPL